MALKTDYKDYIPPSGGRKYKITANSDGSSSVEDITQYQQVGDTWGAEDINQVNKLVNGAVYPNLLDNSDFTNPVNQRGATSYTGTGIYTIDRWKMWGAYKVSEHTLTYSSGNAVSIAGLNACLLMQRTTTVSVGDIVTISAKIDGTVYSKTITLTDSAVAYDMGLFYFVVGDDASAFFEIAIESGSIIIDWLKLEKGSVATPYVPKGYGAELSECLRYYYQVSSVRTFGQQHTGAGTYVNVILPQVMRVTPTVSAPSEWTIRFNGMDKNATVSSVGSLNGNTLNLTMSTIAGGTYIGPLYAFYNDKITFSADL
jgi:hypothetical protein